MGPHFTINHSTIKGNLSIQIGIW